MDASFEHSVLNEFLQLEQGTKVQAEYIWIGGSGQDLRCKTRTLDKIPMTAAELPEWNYDGSSTGQAPIGGNSEVIIKPQAIFRDPFRRGSNILVMCDTYEPNGTPLLSNTRYPAYLSMMKAREHEPWFGIEQEYTLFSLDKTPLGWPKGGYPAPQGPYYCGIGADKAFGRSMVEAHYRACLFAGVKISGVNAEVMPGQWEFQVGPCVGIEMGDHLWVARYIMQRLAERFGIIVSFHPKPILEGDWNGAGCHTNCSTKRTRAEGGITEIYAHVEKLSKRHQEHIAVYGEHNTLRLTGKHETAHITEFRSGVADRKASIRIPFGCAAEGKGYYEDRRPASNIDPYVVTDRIVRTTCLNE